MGTRSKAEEYRQKLAEAETTRPAPWKEPVERGDDLLTVSVDRDDGHAVFAVGDDEDDQDVARLLPEDAVSLGRWLLDTFGAPDGWL